MFLLLWLAAADASLRGVEPGSHLTTSPKTLCADGSSGPMLAALINDEFCDCVDGSDEPGTSACSHLLGRTLTFFCKNNGHLPSRIPVSRVDDGICDCCDGSDEKKCPDTCEQQAEQARLAAQRAQDAQLAGVESHQKRMIKMEGELERLTQALEVLKIVIALREEDLARRRAVQEGKPDSLFVETEEDVGRRVAEQWVSYSKPEEAINDVLSRAQKNLMSAREARQKALPAFPLQFIDNPAITKPEEWDDSMDGEWEHPTYTNPEFTARSADDEQVRKGFEEAKDALKSSQAELQTNYGPGRALRPYKKCTKLTKHGKAYDVCLFGNAAQDSVKLGAMGPLTSTTELPSTLMFSNGDKSHGCANARSLTLTLQCGPKLALLDVDEPSQCRYTGVLAVPAYCKSP